MNTKTVNGMIMNKSDSIASHLIESSLPFYELYRELRSNMKYSLLVDGTETIYLTDNSEAEVYIRTNEIKLTGGTI